MAIVSISKIQHRYGVFEDLPQLSAAELGWTTDQRRLFIGNGPLSEGAPEIGNTEILTEFSDILNVSDFYDYRGEDVGYTHVTGVNLASPTRRTLQSKLDEWASVKDFGAKGDGVTNDTVAINRALSEMYTRQTNTNIRRTLFFPAGTYLISDSIVIPTYARLVGEGKDSSIVTGAAIYLGDSHQQIEPNIGSAKNSIAASYPGFVEICGMTFVNPNDDEAVITIDSADNCNFDRVGFVGYVDAESSSLTDIENSAAAVLLKSSTSQITRDINFSDCDFKQTVFGIVADDDMDNITVNGGVFKNLYKGVKISENTNTGDTGPRSVKITNAQFDDITREGLHVYNSTDVISAFNFYRNVGNVGATPQYHIITFETAGNCSLMDSFARTDLQNESVARINVVDDPDSESFPANYLVKAGDSVTHGRSIISAGQKVLLETPATNSSINQMIFDATNEKSILIYYTATQTQTNGEGEIIAVRNGTLRITADSNGDTVSDEFSENGNSIDLTFSVSVSGGNTTVEYTASGAEISLSYRIEKIF